MIRMDQIDWILPNQCTPGQIVLVHFLWTPFDDSNEWPHPPPPPADQMYGYWAPVPHLPTEEEDLIYQNCSLFVKGLMHLFQDDPQYAVLDAMGDEVRIPWDQPYIVAVCPGES